MTILTSQTVVGVDIAKAEILVYRSDLQTTDAIKNDRTALKRWLKTLPAHSAIAVEATNIYHLDTVELAHAMGHQVYVVDAYRVSNYRRGIGQRAKNDPCDARLLARYLTNEQDGLRIWSPPPKAYTSLKSLLHRRATLIQNHAGLMLSWANEPLLKKVQTAQQKAFKQADQAIQKLLRKVSKEAGIEENIDRCKAIEGVAFIAFLGMDLTVDDSGKKNGPRHLTKKGDPEVRRLAYNAAMAACRSAKWKPFYESYLARGFSKTQALVALARKLCRVAFALMKNQSEYHPV
jgi:transposase